MTVSDTIAAVSTAPGEGGIGIVRVSGDKAAEILGKLFAAPGKKPGETVFEDKEMYYGHIVDPYSAETVDEALVVLMKGPRSYTGEDVCEIQCHGGGVPLRRILELVRRLGAAPAQPGEFSKRAFLNGRLDLIQAGAVIDLIKSKTPRGYHAAKEQAEGRLSERVRAARGILLGALAEIAVRIDYPEGFEDAGAGDRDGKSESKGDGKSEGNGEGVAGFVDAARSADKSYDSIESALAEAAAMVAELLESAEAGRLIRDGVRVVIIGKPNTGKSSLFNALAREDAAIVTATPGTTRDALEIWLDIRGIPVLLTDTAGIHESAEEIESLGIERAREQYRKADMSIFLLDSSEPLSEEDRMIARMLDPEKKLIMAMNKKDMPEVFGAEEAAAIVPFPVENGAIVRLSLIDEGFGNEKEKVREIEQLLEKYVTGDISAGSSLLVTKAQHKALLETAAGEIGEAQKMLEKDVAPEFAEVNIRAAWEALGEMIGETVTDDVIDRVFEDFCIGK